MTGNTAWPHLLADLEAKRDALTHMIENIRTHFVGDVPGEMPESPIVRPARVKKNHRRKAPKARKPPPPTPTRAAARPAVHAPSSSSATQARDAAILARLKQGPAKSTELSTLLPMEVGMNADQMTRACANALTRLRVKKQIKQVGDGWALA